jgi:DNA gyrase subunit B
MGYNAGNIQVLSGNEAIRRRPSMYIGPLDDPTLLNRLIQEALCVAVDEAVSGYCTEIHVEVHPGGQARVRDNGRGLPTKPTSEGQPLAEVLLTKLFACRDRKQNPEVSALCCDAGLVVTNALSEWLVVKNYREGVCWVQEYRRGEPLAPFRRESETTETGLEFTFQPDKTILGPLHFDAQELAGWLKRVGLRFGSTKISATDGSAGETVSLRFEGVGPQPR